jgi:hypothetical protein
VEPDITSGGGTRVRNTWGRGRRRLRIAGAVGGALALGVGLLAVTGPAQALNMSKTGGPDASGFPTHYTDNSGVSLQLCVDGSANCGLATRIDDGAGGPGVDVAPDGEGFYWMATATVNTPRGAIDVEFAHEAAWAAVGQPIVFERTRIRGDLPPGRYTLQHPYGSTQFTADGAGARNVNFTDDLPCGLAQGAFCAAKLTNFLRSTSAPVGYLGNATSATTVTGGTARNSLVLRAANGTVIGRTSRFVVMGQLAPGPSAVLGTNAVDFGNTKSPRRRAVAVRNLGTAPLNFNGIRVVGANRITVAPQGCGASLASGATCRVNLLYRPGVRRSMTGTLVINDNSIGATHRVPLKAMTSGVASSPRRVRFPATSVGSASRVRRVVVSNTGVIPMRIKGVSLSGGNARSFQRRGGQGPLCAKGRLVRPRAACATYVRFAPQNFGLKTTDLVVRTNTANPLHRIALRGRGR